MNDLLQIADLDRMTRENLTIFVLQITCIVELTLYILIFVFTQDYWDYLSLC